MPKSFTKRLRSREVKIRAKRWQENIRSTIQQKPQWTKNSALITCYPGFAGVACTLWTTSLFLVIYIHCVRIQGVENLLDSFNARSHRMLKIFVTTELWLFFFFLLSSRRIAKNESSSVAKITCRTFMIHIQHVVSKFGRRVILTCDTRLRFLCHAVRVIAKSIFTLFNVQLTFATFFLTE